MSAETTGSTPERTPDRTAVTAIAWLWVLVPFAYGLYELLIQVPALFGS